MSGGYALTTTERCIPLSAPDEWRGALAGVPHAFAHTWASCYAMSLTTGHRTFLYAFEADHVRIVCPLAERSYGDHTDVYTPYGFSGFTGTGPHPALASSWAEFARRHGYVCGYFCLNPILHAEQFADARDVRVYNTVFVIDLTPDEGALWSTLHENRRREIAAFTKTGAQLVTSRDALLRFCLEHYSECVRRRGSSAANNLTRESLEALFALDDVLPVGVAAEGDLDAVALFAFTPTVAEFVFHVSAPGAPAHTTAMVWHAMRCLKSGGIPRLNLGGGVRPDDTIAEYKKRFGAATLPLQQATEVYRPDIYAALCERVGVDPDDRLAYFPAYRR